MFVAHLLLWAPIFLLWPLAYIGSRSTINWFIAMSTFTYRIGMFAAYPSGITWVIWATLKEDNGDIEGGANLKMGGYIVSTLATLYVHIKNNGKARDWFFETYS